MNRQLKRKIKRSGLTDKDVEQWNRAAIDYTIGVYEAAVALTLHDKLGFGNKRATRFLAQVQDLFDSIQKGYVSIDDIKETVKKEINIGK